MMQSEAEEDAAYKDFYASGTQEAKEACKRLLFSDGSRMAIVLVSLLTLLPIGVISILFWILARRAWGQGRKKNAADNYHEAETMAVASITFGLLIVLTVLLCIPQLKRGGI